MPPTSRTTNLPHSSPNISTHLSTLPPIGESITNDCFSDSSLNSEEYNRLYKKWEKKQAELTKAHHQPATNQIPIAIREIDIPVEQDPSVEQEPKYPKESQEADNAAANRIRKALKAKKIREQFQAHNKSVLEEDKQTRSDGKQVVGVTKSVVATDSNASPQQPSHGTSSKRNAEKQVKSNPEKKRNKTTSAPNKNKSKKASVNNTHGSNNDIAHTNQADTEGATIDYDFVGCAKHKIQIGNFELENRKEATKLGSTWLVGRLFRTSKCRECGLDGVRLVNPRYCNLCRKEENFQSFAWYCHECYEKSKPQKRQRRPTFKNKNKN